MPLPDVEKLPEQIAVGGKLKKFVSKRLTTPNLLLNSKEKRTAEESKHHILETDESPPRRTSGQLYSF